VVTGFVVWLRSLFVNSFVVNRQSSSPSHFALRLHHAVLLMLGLADDLHLPVFFPCSSSVVCASVWLRCLIAGVCSVQGSGPANETADYALLYTFCVRSFVPNCCFGMLRPLIPVMFSPLYWTARSRRLRVLGYLPYSESPRLRRA
jgi:hypothetical protein